MSHKPVTRRRWPSPKAHLRNGWQMLDVMYQIDQVTPVSINMTGTIT